MGALFMGAPVRPNMLNMPESACVSRTLSDISAGQLIHPQRSPGEVDAMAAEGHDLYRLTSGDYWPGEQRTRYYAHPSYDPCRRFGM